MKSVCLMLRSSYDLIISFVGAPRAAPRKQLDTKASPIYEPPHSPVDGKQLGTCGQRLEVAFQAPWRKNLTRSDKGTRA